MAGTWRVGRHQSQNVYEGDRYVGVCFAPEDAAAIVEAMNSVQRPCATPCGKSDCMDFGCMGATS